MTASDNRSRNGTDWARIASLSDEEIERRAQSDKDNPPTTAEHWENAKTFKGSGNKELVFANLDADVVAWLKAQGGDYVATMNTALRLFMNTFKTLR
jgi:uncharacterized protein (DUF4415 family)